MSTILYIKADPKPEGQSRTFRVSDEFVREYTRQHPQNSIVTLDLYKEGVTFLTQECVSMHRPEPGEGQNHPVLKYAYQFAQADKFIFAEPLWNLGIPAILKAYIDYICITGITFQYTAQGPVGLCQGKKAVNITSRGGGYSAGVMAELELGDRYLKTILGFLGITDYSTVAAENLDVVGVDIESILTEATEKARGLAKNF